MKRLQFSLFSTLFILSVLIVSPLQAAQESIRALWVECEGTNNTLSSKEKILECIDIAAKNNFNTLFVQVFRGHRAWYKSSFIPNEPYKRFLAKEKVDLLQFFIDEAHKQGIEVHAWANQMRVVRNSKKSYPVLERLGKDVVTRNGTGVSLWDFPHEKLPDGGMWLDAGDRKVQRFLADVAEEIVVNYPDLDGYHLDFIRIPFDVPYAGSRWDGRKGFGYGKESVRRFKLKTGWDPMTMEKTRKNTQVWDDWRRDQITEVVRTVSKRVKLTSRKMQVTAAGLCWIDRAYLSSYQDWGQWLDEGIVDALITMNYSIDSRFVNRLSRQALSLRQDSRVYIGLGSYLLEEELDAFEKQIQETLALNPDGVVYFSYDSMLKKPEMFKIVNRQPRNLVSKKKKKSTSQSKRSIKVWRSAKPKVVRSEVQ